MSSQGPDMISPRSIWHRTHMRSIGKWIKRSNTSENGPVAMRSPSLNIDLSSDIASFSPTEERSANRLGHPALELRDRHSFDQTILAEDYSVVSPPVRECFVAIDGLSTRINYCLHGDLVSLTNFLLSQKMRSMISTKATYSLKLWRWPRSCGFVYNFAND